MNTQFKTLLDLQKKGEAKIFTQIAGADVKDAGSLKTFVHKGDPLFNLTKTPSYMKLGNAYFATNLNGEEFLINQFDILQLSEHRWICPLNR